MPALVLLKFKHCKQIAVHSKSSLLRRLQGRPIPKNVSNYYVMKDMDIYYNWATMNIDTGEFNYSVC